MEEQIKSINDMVEDFRVQLDNFLDIMKLVNFDILQGLDDYAKGLLPGTFAMLTHMAAVNNEHYNKIYEAVYDLANRKEQ